MTDDQAMSKPGTTGEDPLAGASIRVVANRTGIAPDTLRVWERRYGFPRPSRRPGGSRVYSESDIARLHVVAHALAAGFRPSEVVALPLPDLRKLVDASAADVPGRSRSGPSRPRSAADVPSPAGPSPGVDAMLEALRADDVVALRARLRSAAVSLGPRAFVTELAHPMVLRIGELWAEGALEVRHEHLASACLTSQLHLLLGALDDGERTPSVLLATLPDEPHVLGLDMVAVYLATSLAAPRLLGADTPPAEVTDAARAMAVDVVGLSISPAADGDLASRAVKAVVAALPSRVELWLGGAGAPIVAAAAPGARLVRTWQDLDTALSAFRSRSPAR
jgi:methylmalonyl-CoA mutase cobalamin-binding subunit